MDFIHVIILSIVEGISEFLPISSTGQLILTSHLLQIPKSDFLTTFELVIQLGAILSVITLYAQRVIKQWLIIPKILTAMIPTSLVGFTLYPLIKHVLLDNPIIVSISLIIGGIAFIILEKYFGKHSQTQKASESNIDISYQQALCIGTFQAISIIPGVSRAGATIFGGLFMKLPRNQAVEFSFLLAVPTMMAAVGLDLIKTSQTFTNTEIKTLITGTVISYIVALISIKWLISYIKNHSFVVFGIYRIIVGLLFLLLFVN